jgi:hypothetical protein
MEQKKQELELQNTKLQTENSTFLKKQNSDKTKIQNAF